MVLCRLSPHPGLGRDQRLRSWPGAGQAVDGVGGCAAWALGWWGCGDGCPAGAQDELGTCHAVEDLVTDHGAGAGDLECL